MIKNEDNVTQRKMALKAEIKDTLQKNMPEVTDPSHSLFGVSFDKVWKELGVSVREYNSPGWRATATGRLYARIEGIRNVQYPMRKDGTVNMEKLINDYWYRADVVFSQFRRSKRRSEIAEINRANAERFTTLTDKTISLPGVYADVTPSDTAEGEVHVRLEVRKSMSPEQALVILETVVNALTVSNKEAA